MDFKIKANENNENYLDEVPIGADVLGLVGIRLIQDPANLITSGYFRTRRC